MTLSSTTHPFSFPEKRNQERWPRAEKGIRFQRMISPRLSDATAVPEQRQLAFDLISRKDCFLSVQCATQQRMFPEKGNCSSTYPSKTFWLPPTFRRVPTCTQARVRMQQLSFLLCCCLAAVVSKLLNSA